MIEVEIDWDVGIVFNFLIIVDGWVEVLMMCCIYCCMIKFVVVIGDVYFDVFYCVIDGYEDE